MRELLILIRCRWLAWRHAAHADGPRHLTNLGLYGYLFVAVQSLILSSLLFFPLYGLVAAEYRALLLRLLVHGLTLAAMTLALTTAANAALGALYEAPYLSVALSWPVGAGVLYAAGLAEVAMTCLSVAMALVAPAWIALGLASHAPWSFVLVGLAGLVAEILFGTALAVLALSLILRLVGTVRLRRLFIVMVLVGTVGLVLFLQVLVLKAMGGGWTEALAGIDLLLHRLAWLPHGLAAQGALAARVGRNLASLRHLGLLWALALGAVGISLQVGAWTYQACWTNVQETGPAKIGRRLKGRRPGIRGVIPAILAKDWRIIVREPLFFANFLVFLLTVAFYVWGLRQNTSGAGAGNPAIGTSYLFLVAVLATGWLAQAGAMAVSREGLAWWQIQCAPVPVRSILRAKLLFGASGLLLFFGSALAILGVVGLPLPKPDLGLPLLGGLVLGLTAAGLLADLILPDFTLRLDVKMSGAHAGGKIKVMLAILATLSVTVLSGLTFTIVQFFLGGNSAALAVLLEGLCLLLLAERAGENLLQRVLIARE